MSNYVPALYKSARSQLSAVSLCVPMTAMTVLSWDFTTIYCIVYKSQLLKIRTILRFYIKWKQLYILLYKYRNGTELKRDEAAGVETKTEEKGQHGKLLCYGNGWIESNCL